MLVLILNIVAEVTNQMLLVLTLRRPKDAVLLSLDSTVALWDKTGFLGRLALVGSVLFVIGGALLCWVVAPLTAWLAGPAIAAPYEHIHQRSQGIELYDSEARYIGIVPAYAGAPHIALRVGQVPETFWRCVVWLEDRHLGGAWAPWGIDFRGLMRVPVDGVRGLLAGHGLRLSGGSTIPMQLSRMMRHDSPGADRGFLDALGRKFSEWWAAPALLQELGGADGARLPQWVATHIPLAQGTRGSRLGGSLYGIKIVSQSVFGKHVDQLNQAEQALLAAAFYRPILLAPASDAQAQGNRDKRWRALKGRAALCLRQLASAAGAEAHSTEAMAYQEALAQLTALPAPQSLLPPDLAHEVEDRPRLDFRLAANPVQRGRYFAGSATRHLMTELADRLPDLEHPPAALHLSIDGIVQARLEKQVTERLHSLDRSLASHLTMPLVGKPDERAQIVVALADECGRLLGYYANTSDPIYFGSSARRDSEGVYREETEDRAIASLAKILGVLAVAGQDEPDTLWCAPAEVRGGACTDDTPRLSARLAIAHSHNGAIFWRLNQLPEEKLRALMGGFGLRPYKGTHPATALALGMVGAAPMTVQRMMATVAAALQGSGGAASQPGLIDAVRLTEEAPLLALPRRAPLESDILKTLQTPKARHFVAEVLGETLHAESAGTLARLASWQAGKHPGVTMHLAKTGTSSALVPKTTRDTWITGALTYRARTYTYVLLIGSPDPNRPLGTTISAGMFAPIISDLLDVVLEGQSLSSCTSPAEG